MGAVGCDLAVALGHGSSPIGHALTLALLVATAWSEVALAGTLAAACAMGHEEGTLPAPGAHGGKRGVRGCGGDLVHPTDREL